MTLLDLTLSGIYTMLFGAVFGGIELIKRKTNVSSEIMRRVAHIASGVLLLLDYYTLSPMVFLVLITGGGVLFYVLSQKGVFTSVNNVARRSVGQYVLTFGYLAAYCVAAFDATVFVPSVLIITFADSAAGLYGTLMKAPNRTWIGSVIFFAVAFGILLSTTAIGIPAALLIASVLTLVERFSPLGFDNISVPLTAALLLLAF